MPRLLHRAPKLRRHKARNLACVTLDGRTIYLGRWKSSEAKREYARIIGEWKAGARGTPRGELIGEMTVSELLAAFMRHALSYYQNSDEPEQFAYSIRELKQLYSRLPVVEFSPLKLQAVRHAMIDAKLSRRLINQRIRRVKSIFAWGVSQELVPSSVLHGLQSIRGLSAGRSKAKETKPVKPVHDAHVDAIREKVSPQIWAMIELQRHTGMRPGEVCRMRTCDIETGAKVWTYTPQRHKTEHHGHSRKIFLGPKAQAAIRRWLRTDLEAYLFQPAEVVVWRRKQIAAARKTPPSCGNRAGTNRQRSPKKKPGDVYSVRAYHQAIRQACIKAKVPTWHPHQLRHNAATNLRKEFGLEIARVVLGHRSPQITEVYAELDHDKARQVMGRVG